MSEKTEKTREKILDTAIKHFLRDGFSGASLRNVGECRTYNGSIL